MIIKTAAVIASIVLGAASLGLTLKHDDQVQAKEAVSLASAPFSGTSALATPPEAKGDTSRSDEEYIGKDGRVYASPSIRMNDDGNRVIETKHWYITESKDPITEKNRLSVISWDMNDEGSDYSNRRLMKIQKDSSIVFHTDADPRADDYGQVSVDFRFQYFDGSVVVKHYFASLTDSYNPSFIFTTSNINSEDLYTRILSSRFITVRITDVRGREEVMKFIGMPKATQ